MLNQVLIDGMLYGGKAKAVSYKALDIIRQDVEALQNTDMNSQLIETVVRDFYRFTVSDVPFEVRSIVVVASPSPLVKVNFYRSGEVRACFTDGYAGNRRMTADIEAELIRRFTANGYSIRCFGALPQKQLAVRSGLGQYGRNNIVYVEGIGSFVQLTTFLTDMPCEDLPLHGLGQMDSCKRCGLCIAHCPTGAISKDRYLVNAERCLTYFNEFIDLAPFPEWIPNTAHNSMHGCMKCQVDCPQNKPFLDRTIYPVEFTERETDILLEGRNMEALPQDLARKVRELGLEDYLSLLPRNLTAVFQQW